MLKEKHLEALDTQDYLQKKIALDLDKIQLDESGAVWHKKEMHSYAQDLAQKMDASSSDEKKSQPLFGLSVGLKDLFCVKGLTTTAGSRVLQHFKSPYDSTVSKTLSIKGSLLTAKLAMDEFAMGSFSNTSSFGRVSVPGFSNHTAGGSSGGSAAAVAAGLVDFSVGSDTGGSVRLPASFCSVVGYKPSYGAFSRYGMIAYASSLDQAGFLTHDLSDLRYLLESDIALKDKKDMTSRGLGLYYPSHVDIKTLKMGYFPHMLEDESISLDVRNVYQQSLDKLIASGIQVSPVNVSLMHEAAQIYYILACSEASSNLARYQGVYFGEKLIEHSYDGTFWQQAAQYRSEYFGIEVQKRIMLGSFILSAENFSSMYQKANILRQAIKEQFVEVFKNVDALMLPVSPMTAPKWEDIEKMSTAQIYLSDYMTVAFSLAGLPALSLPWGKNSDGLGIGMQFVGPQMQDYQLIDKLIAIEAAFK